jgi:peptidyl-prolyl cis-trans isomerase B (cyclophilin B)
VFALVPAACGDDDDQSADEKDSTAAPAAEQQPGKCKDVEQPAPRDGGGQEKPDKPLDASKTYEVELQTSCGSFTIRLDQKTSPNAAASFAGLARNGFFDDTIFHRIVPGFVIQGGDPTASGTGGPGYSTRDPVPASAAYKPGVVAMAKAGNEPAGTAGSQFFVVTAAGSRAHARLRAAGQRHEGHGRRAGDRRAGRPGQWRRRHASTVSGDRKGHR